MSVKLSQRMEEGSGPGLSGPPQRSGGERSEPERSGGGSERPAALEGVPSPAVLERSTRRRFTAEYKLHVLKQADACKVPGEIGALLRREGLYSSHLVEWRRQRERITQAGMEGRKRGPKPRGADPRIVQLERENKQLRRRLERVDLLLDIQKKASVLLGIPLNRPDSEEND